MREHSVTIQRGTGRVNLKQQSTDIPYNQSRSFRDTKRENTSYVSQVKIVLDEKTPTEAQARDYSEGLVPQYFDVSFCIAKLLLYN